MSWSLVETSARPEEEWTSAARWGHPSQVNRGEDGRELEREALTKMPGGKKPRRDQNTPGVGKRASLSARLKIGAIYMIITSIL